SFAEQIYALQMAIANEERDRITESEAQLTLLADLVPGVPAWRCSLALLHAPTGREAEARAALVRLAAPDFPALPRDTGFVGALASLAQVVVALGDTIRGGILYDLLLPYAERAVVIGFGIGCYGAAARYLALLGVTLERLDDAT